VRGLYAKCISKHALQDVATQKGNLQALLLSVFSGYDVGARNVIEGRPGKAVGQCGKTGASGAGSGRGWEVEREYLDRPKFEYHNIRPYDASKYHAVPLQAVSR
jgi:hypothetical protein